MPRVRLLLILAPSISGIVRRSRTFAASCGVAGSAGFSAALGVAFAGAGLDFSVVGGFFAPVLGAVCPAADCGQATSGSASPAARTNMKLRHIGNCVMANALQAN